MKLNEKKKIIVGGITPDGKPLNEEEWRKQRKNDRKNREEEIELLARANGVEIF